MGTALTSEHLPLLRKGEPKVILAYDGDKAGVAAALKGAVMLSHARFDGGVVLFPDGQDPADMISKGESGVVASLFRNSKQLIPFVIEQLAGQYDLRNPKEKENAYGVIRNYMSGLSEIMRESYISNASSILGVATSMFTRGNRNSPLPTSGTEKKYDIEQLSMLRTMMEYPRLTDDILNYLVPEMLGDYAGHFDAIVREEWSNHMLVELSLNENTIVMEEVDLWRSVQSMQIIYYSRMLEKINSNNTLSVAAKIKLIRKLKMDIIPKLKRGERVFYDSTITI
jgi:DNA primase